MFGEISESYTMTVTIVVADACSLIRYYYT